MFYFSVLLLSLEKRSTTSNHASGALAIGLPKQSCEKPKTKTNTERRNAEHLASHYHISELQCTLHWDSASHKTHPNDKKKLTEQINIECLEYTHAFPLLLRKRKVKQNKNLNAKIQTANIKIFKPQANRCVTLRVNALI